MEDARAKEVILFLLYPGKKSEVLDHFHKSHDIKPVKWKLSVKILLLHQLPPTPK